jgi:hypothetical protein
VERNQWRYLIIHHSATPGGNAAGFDRMHRAKGWDSIGYHFVIDNGCGGPDGRLEVTSRWWAQKHGAHAGHLANVSPDERNLYNEFGIGICLVGNLDRKPPTRAQLATLARLIGRLRDEFAIAPEDILGHGQVKGTACPGRYFPWKGLFARLDLPPPQHLYPHPVSTTTEHCPWCREQEAAAAGKSAVASSGQQSAPGKANRSDLPPPVLLQGQ